MKFKYSSKDKPSFIKYFYYWYYLIYFKLKLWCSLPLSSLHFLLYFPSLTLPRLTTDLQSNIVSLQRSRHCFPCGSWTFSCLHEDCYEKIFCWLYIVISLGKSRATSWLLFAMCVFVIPAFWFKIFTNTKTKTKEQRRRIQRAEGTWIMSC